ncbi:MAG: stage II sporulation protein M [Kiritimatiellia bacterium]
MIDLERFIENERPFWTELETILDSLHRNSRTRMSMPEIRRFHYLYERVSADLAKLRTFTSEKETRKYLESMVARAYAEIHETRTASHRFKPFRWLAATFPRTFRRRALAFRLACGTVLAGAAFSSLLMALDPSSKEIFMPFPHLLEHPSERVEREEGVTTDRLQGRKAQGAAWYMKHNTGVAVTTMAMGATWGIGTLLMLFSTGAMLGAVSIDYVMAGETTFLLGWLLPHGSVEIPAILLAGQAGFVLAGALIGRGTRTPLRTRLREISSDLVTLIAGTALLLVWAGIVEAFFSQYHQPLLPYWIKIAFGASQLFLLIIFLNRAGRKPGSDNEKDAE